jgi:uncharacterized protein YdhG (YjbR/CyaY superfamily)
MKETSPATIDDYLAPLPAADRAALENLRQTIKSAAPEASEGIGYGIPGFKYKGKHLVSFGAWKNHLAVYGMNSVVAQEYPDDPNAFDISGGTIRFTADKPLPPDLIKKLVQARIEAIEGTSKPPSF